MRNLFCLIICFVWQSSHADLQHKVDEVVVKASEASKKINPLKVQQDELLKKASDLSAQLEATNADVQKLQLQTTEIQKNTKSILAEKELEDLLLNNKIGKCKISRGEMSNEFFIKLDGTMIRIIFSKEGQQQPTIRLENEYFVVEQEAYTPIDSTNKTSDGVMRADIRFDKNHNVLHAVFKGETIKDKGFWGMSGSSFAPQGITCITMEAVDSI